MRTPRTNALGVAQVGVLDGFNATWSQARQTYGEGTPQTGEKFDASSTLDQLKSDMDGAAPGGRWTGGASEAYGAANTEHQRVIGAIGDLDERLGLSTDDINNTFDSVDTDEPVERPVAKGIFSVLSTQEDAFKEFHSAADAQIIAASHAWAEDVKNGVALQPNDERLLDAQTLKGLGAVGTTEAANALGVNATQMYEQQRAAYDQALKIVTTGSGFIPGYGQFLAPGIDQFGSYMQGSVLGEAPNSDTFTIPPLDQGESARFALNALLANDVPLVDNTDGQFNTGYYEPIDPERPELGHKPVILDMSGLAENKISPNTAEDVLTQLIRDTLPLGSDPTTAMKDKYDDITANPSPNTADGPGE